MHPGINTAPQQSMPWDEHYNEQYDYEHEDMNRPIQILTARSINPEVLEISMA